MTLVVLRQVTQGVQYRDVEVVWRAQFSVQGEVSLGGEEVPCFAGAGSVTGLGPVRRGRSG